MSSPILFGGNSTANNLQANLQLNNGAGPIVYSGTVDPSAVATAGVPGSLYLNTSGTGTIYKKEDSGTTTNWSPLISVSSMSPNDDVGAIITSASASAPAGTFVADGTAVSRTTYAALFAKIGTVWGVGDGSTTFNIPDLRGIFLRGAGVNATLLDAIGTGFTGTLGTYQNDKMQGHAHQIYDNENAQGKFGAAAYSANAGASSWFTNPSLFSDGTNGTPRTGAETNPANAGVNYYIRYSPSTGVGSGGASGITRIVSSISAPATAGATASTDYIYFVSGTTTITLPTAVGNTNRYSIKNTGVNTVTVATTSSQTIDGSTTASLPVANTSLDLISDNAN